MPLFERIHNSFINNAQKILFEFFSPNYPKDSQINRPISNPDLERAIHAELGPQLGRKGVSYHQVYRWVKYCGELVEGYSQEGDPIGLSLQDHAHWYTAEFSIVGSKRWAVGSYSGWSAQDILDTWRLTKVTTIIVDSMVLAKLIQSQLKWPETINQVILIGEEPGYDLLTALSSREIGLSTLNLDFLSSPNVVADCVDGSPALTIFTSGTSGGCPKGVVWSEERWSESKQVSQAYDSISAHEPSWSTGKHTAWASFLSGGKISFIPKGASPFAINYIVRPNRTILVPFQAKELHSLYLHFLQKEKNRLSKKEDSPAVITALGHAHALYYVYEYLLGGNVKTITVGGAAVTREIKAFLGRLPVYLRESYGQTESRGLLDNGFPSKGIALKLLSLPEEGYTTDDKPHPRGELVVKSSLTTPASAWIGDKKQLDEIRGRFMEDGFFRTGDIAEKLKDGSYRIIDRVSSLEKLDNGKYVSPEQIEEAIAPQSMKLESGLTPSSCFVALDTSRSATQVMFRFDSPIEESKRAALASELLKKMRLACQSKGVAKGEIPIRIVIDDLEDGGWSLENGILNRSRKLIRRELHKRLETIIATRQANTLINSIPMEGEWDYPKTPLELASWLFRQVNPEVDSFDEAILKSSLPEIGFDSVRLAQLGAILPQLLNELRARGCVNVRGDNSYFPTPLLMRRSMLKLAQDLWRENLENSQTKGIEGDTKCLESGNLTRQAETLPASEFKVPLLESLNCVEIAVKRQLAAHSDLSSTNEQVKWAKISTKSTRILVTGCAGFLGKNIVRDLLKSPWVGEVICLVRGTENEKALSRVRRVVLADHEALSSDFEKKIKVLEGDLTQDKFGLAEKEYEALVHDRAGRPAIDLIIHAAAMIKNWGLENGLELLVEPNVMGSLRIARLAFEISRYRKQHLTPVVYVSTNSVTCSAVTRRDKTRIASQNSWFDMFDSEAVIKRNLNAYSATKLMAEQLLRESGLPLSIIRAPLLTWHSVTGEGNSDDWLNRLVDACINTKMIPRFESEVSVGAMPVNQCSELVIAEAKSLLKTGKGFSITYPHESIPKIQLNRVFEQLEELAIVNQLGMTTMPLYVWKHGIESLSYTAPTRFNPLLSLLSGIVKKTSDIQDTKLEGSREWLKRLLSDYYPSLIDAAASLEAESGETPRKEKKNPVLKGFRLFFNSLSRKKDSHSSPNPKPL